MSFEFQWDGEVPIDIWGDGQPYLKPRQKISSPKLTERLRFLVNMKMLTMLKGPKATYVFHSLKDEDTYINTPDTSHYRLVKGHSTFVMAGVWHTAYADWIKQGLFELIAVTDYEPITYGKKYRTIDDPWEPEDDRPDEDHELQDDPPATGGVHPLLGVCGGQERQAGGTLHRQPAEDVASGGGTDDEEPFAV